MVKRWVLSVLGLYIRRTLYKALLYLFLFGSSQQPHR